MEGNSYVSFIAHTTKSQWKKGNIIGVDEIRKKYGDRISSIPDNEIKATIDKMHKKLTDENNNIKKKQEVPMPKQEIDKDEIKNAIEDCLKSGKCDSFNALSRNIDSNKKELSSIKASVDEGCSKLASLDDIKSKINDQNNIISDLTKDKKVNNNKDDSDINKLAVVALKTFATIRDKESELTDRIKALIDVNKGILKKNDTTIGNTVPKQDPPDDKNKNNVDNIKSKVDTPVEDAVPKNKDDFITLDEALKHKEFADNIIKRIIDNKDIKDKLGAIFKNSEKDESHEEHKDIPKSDNVEKEDAVLKDEKIIDKINKGKGVSILKKLIGKI